LSALQEWYRYVDSLVRPSRKFEELEEWWVPDDALGRGEATARSDEVARMRVERAEAGHLTPDEVPPAPTSSGTDRTPIPLPRSAPPPAVRLPVPIRPVPPPVDPRAVVARLSGRVDDGPPSVQWTTIPGECKIPDLDEFIPNLGSPSSPGTATREFIEGVARFQAPPRRIEEPPPPPTAPPLPEREADVPPPTHVENRRILDTFDPGAWRTSSGPSRETREPPPAPTLSFEPEAAPPVTEAEAVVPKVAVVLEPILLPFLPVDVPTSTPNDEIEPGLPEETSINERSGLPTIGSIREGLPRTMERLLQIPTAEEVAQNSYKSPFRETREELIHRLFDPPLTLEDTARLLGVCPTTVRRYTNKGLLRHYRTQGNQRRFRLSDLLAFLERWGDAGPEAGALGGSASTRRTSKGGAKSPRRSTKPTGGSRDGKTGDKAAAPEDAGRPDAD
jgi:excisionase family DNA binding protein